jgi:DNA topoisomerase-1
MIKRRGRFGEFLGCTGYSIKNEDGKPACETIINLDKEGRPLPPKTKVQTNVPCEKCGSAMILRDSKRGPFLGCSAFPKCRATKQVAKLEGKVREYVDTLIPALKEGGAKAAELAAQISAQFGQDLPPPVATGPIPTDIDCDDCGKPMMIRNGRKGRFLGCSGYPKCKNTAEVPAKLLEEMGLNGNGDAVKDPPPLPQEHEEAA